MKKLIFTATAMLISAIGVAQSTTTTNDKGLFEVSISADTLVSPDIFYLAIQIADNKGIGKQGIDNVESKTLVPTLKREGVDTSKDLVIASVYSSYTEKGKDVMTKSYLLTVRDAAKVKGIIETLRSEDIVVSIQDTEISNRREIEQELRIKALKASKAEAVAILSAVGYRVDKLQKVSVNIYNYRGGLAMPTLMSRKASDQSNESVESFNKQNISASIVASYSICEY